MTVPLPCPVGVFTVRSVAATCLAASIGVASACTGQGDAPAGTSNRATVSAVPVSVDGLTTVTGKAPRGAVVVLASAAAELVPVPDHPAVMDQRGQQFNPNFLVTRAGQLVEFRNSESIVHNVYVTRGGSGAEVLNVGTDPGQSHAHAFKQPGRYDVSCDIHPGMMATIVVVNSPYVAVGDDFGNFTLMNVPPGTYRLEATHAGQSAEREVEIAGTHASLDRVMP